MSSTTAEYKARKRNQDMDRLSEQIMDACEAHYKVWNIRNTRYRYHFSVTKDCSQSINRHLDKAQDSLRKAMTHVVTKYEKLAQLYTWKERYDFLDNLLYERMDGEQVYGERLWLYDIIYDWTGTSYRQIYPNYVQKCTENARKIDLELPSVNEPNQSQEST